KLDRLEERVWWFAAAHANLLMLARGFDSSAAPDRVLDAGCGTGGLLTKLAADRPAAMVIGLDADQAAGARAKAKSARPGWRGAAAPRCRIPAALCQLLERGAVSADGDHPQAAAVARQCQRRQIVPGADRGAVPCRDRF